MYINLVRTSYLPDCRRKCGLSLSVFSQKVVSVGLPDSPYWESPVCILRFSFFLLSFCLFVCFVLFVFVLFCFDYFFIVYFCLSSFVHFSFPLSPLCICSLSWTCKPVLATHTHTHTHTKSGRTYLPETTLTERQNHSVLCDPIPHH